MPQPAFRVKPASVFFVSMLSMESLSTSDTVQFMVEVSALCAPAPALAAAGVPVEHLHDGR